MVHRRIEFDPTDGTQFAAVAQLLAAYDKARRNHQPVEALRRAVQLEPATETFVDALLAEADGTLSRRAMAQLLGVTHGTVNNRIARHRQRQTDQEQP